MVPITGRGGSAADPDMVRFEGAGLPDTEWVRTTGRPSPYADPGRAADNTRRSPESAPEWERMKGREAGDPDVTTDEAKESSTSAPDWERMRRRKGQDVDPPIDEADAAEPSPGAEWERMRRRKGQDASPPIDDEEGQGTPSPEWQKMKRRRRIAKPGSQRTAGGAGQEAGAAPTGPTDDGATAPYAAIDTGADTVPADDPQGRRFDPRPAEAVVRSFTNELKTAARHLNSNITITQADRMKVEISSREKALVLFFAWRDLDFDRIVLRETPVKANDEDDAPKRNGLQGVRETLKRILGRHPADEVEQTTFLRVATVQENGSSLLQWQGADQPNGNDDLVAKMRTAMAVRYVDPGSGRDWFIELVSDGSKMNLNAGKGKGGRDLDVRGAKRKGLIYLA